VAKGYELKQTGVLLNANIGMIRDHKLRFFAVME